MAVRVKYDTPDGGRVESVLVGDAWDVQVFNAEGDTTATVTLSTKGADALMAALLGLRT